MRISWAYYFLGHGSLKKKKKKKKKKRKKKKKENKQNNVIFLGRNVDHLIVSFTMS